jgi:hypothetical protein
MLLQVPDSVVDRNSPAWNGGAVYISRDEVGAAYLSQFCKDFSAFLAARAGETLSGGYMFICLAGRNSVNIKLEAAKRDYLTWWVKFHLLEESE